MKAVSLALVLALGAAPAAYADDLCSQLSHAIGMAKTGFGPAEGDPIATDSGQYRHSTIQLSAGENCAIEGDRLLSCSWEPSTEGDLAKMVASVAACFPAAEKTTTSADDSGPGETDFKFETAKIEIGLTADVLSLNVGPP
jgi:hypothetical protein